MDTILCSGCKTEKPTSQFYTNPSRKNGYNNQCKACCLKAKKPCARCGKPCWRTHCMPCSFIVKPVAERTGVSPAAPKVRQPKRKGLTKYLTPLVITQKPTAPSSSWWTERDFSAAFARELPRLLAVKVSANLQINTVLD